MQLKFSYDRKKVLQALRYHFLWQPEMRILIVIILAFDATTAILYFMGKIRPEPFLLGSCIWLLFMASFWYFMPASIYNRNSTFKDHFTIVFKGDGVWLKNVKSEVEWEWDSFVKFSESPNFFHLYFSPRSFFLVPKDNMDTEFKFDLRLLLSDKIKNTK